MKALPVSLTHVLTILSGPLMNKNETITHTDDILIQTDTKSQIFARTRKLHESQWKSILEVSSDKTYFS